MVGMRGSMSLRRVLAIMVLAAALIPLLGISLLLGVWLVPLMEEQIVHSNQGLARAMAIQTEHHLLTPQHALVAVAGQIRHHESVRETQVVLDALVRANDIFEAIYVLDEHQRIYQIALPEDARMSRREFLGLDLSEAQPVVAAIRTREHAWSDAQLSPITARSVVMAVVPAGKRLVVGEISLERLSHFVRQMVTQDTRMIILDRRGLAVAHPDAGVTFQQVNFSHLPLFRAEGGADNTERFVFDGQRVIGTRVSIPVLSWHVLILQPVALVYRPVIFIAGVLILCSVLATGLFMALGFRVTRRLSERFETLAGLSEELASGNYPSQWPPASIPEIARLSISLKTMAQSVQDREQALRTLNLTLEDKVAARSAELTEAQTSLMRVERMAALGAMVAGVAHELNTPIGNGLITATALEEDVREFAKQLEAGLRRSVLDAHVDKSRQAAQILVRNLKRAAELVSSFKQVAIDQTTAQRRNFDLGELTREIVLTLTPSLGKNACRVRMQLDQGINLDSFPGPLGQVLANLISNAMIHGYDGKPGEVEVTVSREGDAWANIEVVDQGNGIPSEVIGRIFDPFFTTRLGKGGSGLGLHICYNIVVNLLGGSIRVSSVQGEGSRFCVRVPLKAPQRETA